MKAVIAAAFAFLVAGCTVQKDLVPTGGSRADGTVTLSYEYGRFEKPQVDMPKAAAAAMQRCGIWGYTGAEPFGGQMNRCQGSDGYGNCTRTLVTVTYQCTGAPSAGK